MEYKNKPSFYKHTNKIININKQNNTVLSIKLGNATHYNIICVIYIMFKYQIGSVLNLTSP